MDWAGGVAGMAARITVYAITPTRLYIFQGSPNLDALVATNVSGVDPTIELPEPLDGGELHVWGRKGKQRSEQLAWLAGPGVFFGKIGTTSRTDSNSQPHVIFSEQSLLQYPNDAGAAISLAALEFHFLFLFHDKLVAVNTLNEEVAFELSLTSERALDLGVSGVPVRLCVDPAGPTVYLLTEDSLFEVVVRDEGRDMWRLHLARGEHAAALEHCPGQTQRDVVYVAQAEAAFSDGDYLRAATFFAKAAASCPFEEVALRFVQAGEPKALRYFLLNRLDSLKSSDRAQATMLVTWLTELYLHELSHGTAEGESDGPDDPAVLKEFRAFLGDHAQALDEPTTRQLLGDYGRVEELVYFAELRGDHETVVAHHIQRGNAERAIMILRKPSVPAEMQYKFAPGLIALAPADAVDSWIACGLALEPRRLIPALMTYSDVSSDDPDGFLGGFTPAAASATTTRGASQAAGREQAVRYLEHCYLQLGSKDPAIHNLLLTLHVQASGGEGPLLRYIVTARGEGGAPLYDAEYALRLCLQRQRKRAAVHLYSAIGAYEEAVMLALEVDLSLAKTMADKPEEDDTLRKALWLRIARHVIQEPDGGAAADDVSASTSAENIKKAITFLRETDGLLKVEDILPFFPDFVLIDDFKEAVCTSLEEYNRQIEELRQEMQDSNASAEAIRRDIAGLAERTVTVDREERCAQCETLLITPESIAAHTAANDTGALPPFYIFPCGTAFHTDCLLQIVKPTLGKVRGKEAQKLLAQLDAAVARAEDSAAAAAGGEDAHRIRTRLEDIIAAECPFWSENLLSTIAKPFITESDDQQSWRV